MSSETENILKKQKGLYKRINLIVEKIKVQKKSLILNFIFFFLTPWWLEEFVSLLDGPSVAAKWCLADLFRYKNFIQCVAPTQVAVTRTVTQTPKYIFCMSSEQQDALHDRNQPVGLCVWLTVEASWMRTPADVVVLSPHPSCWPLVTKGRKK